jgi:hypothetical protein
MLILELCCIVYFSRKYCFRLPSHVSQRWTNLEKLFPSHDSPGKVNKETFVKVSDVSATMFLVFPAPLTESHIR